MRKTTLHPVARDVLISGVTSVVVSCASLLVVSLVGRLGDPKAVAEYLLMRRVSAWILSGVLLGITMALPRYVAYAVNQPRLQKNYFWAALGLGMAATSVVALVIDLGSSTFSRLLFGDREFKALIVPLSLLLLANGLHATVFGFYRGRLQMERANALQFLNFAAFPLAAVVVLWMRGSVASMFLALSLLILGSSALMAIPVFREKSEPHVSWRGISTELLRYGIARIPGDLALGALFTLAPVVASHYIELPKLAPLLLGLGILNVLGTGANPLNQVLLSKVTMMLAENRMLEARTYIEHLLGASVEISFFICVQAVVFADVVIRVWVGPRYLSEMLLIRILLAAVPFYLLHTALRCVIDAASVTAYNTRNILVTCAVFMVVMFGEIRIVPAAHLLDSIAAAFLFGLGVLGWLTVKSLKHLYDVRFSWRSSAPSFVFASLLGVASFAFRRAEHFHTTGLEFITLQVMASLLLLGFLSLRGSSWLGFLREAFLQRQVVPAAEDLIVLRSA
jgi:O-antigen/teichoic acid export membrane protein